MMKSLTMQLPTGVDRCGDFYSENDEVLRSARSVRVERVQELDEAFAEGRYRLAMQLMNSVPGVVM